jgi:subtilisin family serine protease
MEVRMEAHRKSVLSTTLFVLSALVLSACGQPDKAENLIPAMNETCGGAAIQNRYIVHYKSGRWDYVKNPDRENFKSTFVQPQVDEIDFIEYDQKIHFRSDVPVISTNAMGIDNWGINTINAPHAWQNGLRGQNTLVAVIDSGVDTRHSQLRNQIAYNPGESGTLANNGIDDDGNGFIDDYEGYNFYDDNGNVTDRLGHGTHVAGIIAAQHDDNLHMTGYVQGIAPQAKILPVKFLGEDGGTMSGALRSIDYAISRGAKIINASWGGTGCSLSLRQKVSEVANRNILFVAAAGNNGVNLERYPEYPAAFNLPTQITVGAIGETLFMANYSNYSTEYVHIFAPGSQVVSTIPGQAYAAYSGTSMATPFVAGAAAVLLSARPDLSPADLRRLLFTTVQQDNTYSNLTRGRLNLGSAVNALSQ